MPGYDEAWRAETAAQLVQVAGELGLTVAACAESAGLVGQNGIGGPVSVRLDVLAVGVLSAALTGILCIRYFLRYVQTRSFTPFVLYRVLLACVVVVFYMCHGG